MNITSEVKKGENSTVDIIGEISAEDFASYREAAVKKIGENVELKGFRKGAAPADMLEKHVGPMAILDEMAHMAVSAAFPELIKKHDVKAIGQPSVNITKLAPDNPLGFTITLSVLPEIKLADYKAIAKKEMGKKADDTVSDEELETAIKEIRKMRAQQTAIQEEKDPAQITDEDLPELDDEYVKSLGKFDNVADFREKLRTNLGEEKKAKDMEKKQIATMEAIIKKSKFEVPQMLIDFELEKMMHQLDHDIAMTGMDVEEYLKKIEKTRDDLKSEWTENATQRAQMQLIINEIASVEKLNPTTEEIEKEAAEIMERYKDAEGVSETSVRAYVASMMSNKNVFDFLAGQK
jgi:FKBP-type peptidyl-prolyl cis-trans isomerase (trigger factor)